MTFINNHHAYLVVGNKQDLLPTVLKLAEDISGVTEVIHPDKMIWDISSWGVDDSRAIKEWQSRRPVGKAKCGIIACESMTEAAGQALLKVLEEPEIGVHLRGPVFNGWPERLCHTQDRVQPGKQPASAA